MLVTLDTPYVDATADDLTFAVGLAEQPALHVLDLADRAGPGTRLQLRLLGASHQVLLDTPDGQISETVACLPRQRPAAWPAAVPALGRATGRAPRAATDLAPRLATPPHPATALAPRPTLPAAAERRVAGCRYRFRAWVVTAPARVREVAEVLAAGADRSRDTLAGIFPGAPHACTVLRADLRAAPRRVGWLTWHTYPQTGELVTTMTTVVTRHE